jgi:hypothetical protein
MAQTRVQVHQPISNISFYYVHLTEIVLKTRVHLSYMLCVWGSCSVYIVDNLELLIHAFLLQHMNLTIEFLHLECTF